MRKLVEERLAKFKPTLGVDGPCACGLGAGALWGSAPPRQGRVQGASPLRMGHRKVIEMRWGEIARAFSGRQRNGTLGPLRRVGGRLPQCRGW